MRGILPIDRLMRGKQSLRMSQGRFSRGGSLLSYPPISTTRDLEDGSRAMEDGVDAAVPVDASMKGPLESRHTSSERSVAGL